MCWICADWKSTTILNSSGAGQRPISLKNVELFQLHRKWFIKAEGWFKQCTQFVLYRGYCYHKLCDKCAFGDRFHFGQLAGVGRHIENSFASFAVHNFALQPCCFRSFGWTYRTATLHCQCPYKNPSSEQHMVHVIVCNLWYFSFLYNSNKRGPIFGPSLSFEIPERCDFLPGQVNSRNNVAY